MKSFSITTLAVLLSIAGLAYGEPTKKSTSSNNTAKSSSSAPRKTATKDKDTTAAKTPKKSTPPKDSDSDDKAKEEENKSTTGLESPTLDETVTEGGPGVKKVAAVSTIAPEELSNFEHYAPQLQQLVRDALELTKLNLTYTFGSADPSQGGMDCSGAIVYLLKGLGMKGVPRQSDEICGWIQERTLLHRVTGAADSLKHPEFSALQPGDLLFWSGTYVTAPRKIPVTHVMMYLGKLKKTGKHVVFGSSDGRAYQGARRTGVSVFDFSLPRVGSTSTFYGYGLIPAIGKVTLQPPPTEAKPELASDTPAPAKEDALTKSVTNDEPALEKTESAAVPPKKAKAAPNKSVAAVTKTGPKVSVTSPVENKAAREKVDTEPVEPVAQSSTQQMASIFDTPATATPNKEEEKLAPTSTQSSAEASKSNQTYATTQEEVRRALPPAEETADKSAVATSQQSSSSTAKTGDNAKPKSNKTQVTSSNTKKSRAASQANSSTSKTKQRTPPRELTAREKFEGGANRFANSVKKAFGN